MQLTDESEMPYGKFKGEKMANVPASHLLWLYDNDKASPAVKEYIEDNLDVLRKDIK